MTIAEVLKRVAEIEAEKESFWEAHRLEDSLHQDVLRAIAAGVAEPDALAKAAMQTTAITFSRMYD